jgi:hypothetical protein
VTTFFTTLGIVTAALLGLGALLNPLMKKLKRFTTWLDQFMRDWEGEEAAPGRDAVPGVMQRLNRLDGELSNNGGKSTKDVVDKLLKNQEMLLEAFVEMGERLIAIEKCVSHDEIKPHEETF